MANSEHNLSIQDSFVQVDGANSKIDIRKWLYKMLFNWHLFVIVLFLAMIGAFIVNKTILPQYKVRASVLIKETESGGSLSAGGVPDLMSGLFGQSRNVANQFAILSSYKLINRAAKKLPLEVAYEKLTLFKNIPYYKDSPIKVVFDTLNAESSDLLFRFEYLEGNKFEISSKGNKKIDSFEKEGIFGQKLTFAWGALTIFKQDLYWDDEDIKPVSFRYMSPLDLYNQFSQIMKLDYIMEDATIVEINIVSNNPARDQEFLLALTNEFLNENLERKNIEAIRTIDFIDNQLKQLSDSLTFAENSLENFRSTNLVLNLDAQAQILLEQMTEMDKSKSILKVQAKYYEYLLDYVQKGDLDKEIISPVTVGVVEPAIVKYTADLSELQMRRKSIGSNNAISDVIETKLSFLRQGLHQTVQNVLNSTNIQIADIDKRIGQFESKVELLPGNEKKLLNLQRRFKVTDEYYTFLLQKKSEAQIIKASSTPDNIILDDAMVMERTNAKTLKINYLLAIFLGLAIPFGYLIVIDYIGTTIQSKEDIESVTNLPVLGMVPRKEKFDLIPVLEAPKSTFSEGFRSLRTRLEFMAKGQQSFATLITSCLPGEGKTFVSLNLSAVFGLADKKTILLGFDLRKPKVASYLKVKAEKGLSNYLIGAATLDEIVVRPNGLNFDIIFSGPIPPNPGELLGSDRMTDLFRELRLKYDLIIIDSAPVGLVNDTFLLAKHVDVNVFVVRHKRTDKELLRDNLAAAHDNNMENIAIAVNDVFFKTNMSNPFNWFGRTGLKYGSGYGGYYGYGYNYGYGYGFDIGKKNGYLDD